MRTTELENENRLAGSGEDGLKESSPGPRPLAGFDLTSLAAFDLTTEVLMSFTTGKHSQDGGGEFPRKAFAV
jgi:hypothetical protein